MKVFPCLAVLEFKDEISSDALCGGSATGCVLGDTRWSFSGGRSKDGEGEWVGILISGMFLGVSVKRRRSVGFFLRW